jgi:hypothetical protein
VVILEEVVVLQAARLEFDPLIFSLFIGLSGFLLFEFLKQKGNIRKGW